jgi:hypothetical protein
MLNFESNPNELDYKKVFKLELNPKSGGVINMHTRSGTKK